MASLNMRKPIETERAGFVLSFQTLGKWQRAGEGGGVGVGSGAAKWMARPNRE